GQSKSTTAEPMKVVVFGAGLVGGPMAQDLAKDHDVTVCDIREDALARLSQQARLHTKRADLSSASEVKKLAAEHDLVLSAVPGDYAAVFSPVDVIEEYVRPARYVENGHLVVRPALSDAEYIDFPEVGTLEAFNTDGLRTMAKTMKVRNMKEKTMRYPGHIEK